MSFSDIEVNYNNDVMSRHVMIDLQCSNNAGGIAALNTVFIIIIIIIIIIIVI